MGDSPLIIAHRGASLAEVENTVSAFARAAADGADGVELDVLLCASGEVVVFHDDDLARLAGRPEAVADLSLAALRRVRLPRGESIPTLDDAFAASGRLLVNVELKSRGFFDQSLPALVEGVSAALDRGGGDTAARVIVSSFDPHAVGLWQKRRPDVPAALLVEDGSLVATAKVLALPVLRPQAIHPQASLCRRDAIAAWHAAGYMVNTWTVDAPDELRQLTKDGVDGLITNDPKATRTALAG